MKRWNFSNNVMPIVILFNKNQAKELEGKV
ncbi:hypothetical protein PGPR2_03770 [Pseudomonas aeruginosa PGPR2]|nr:hypothetical protein PGPR2_03770 [Pseudomonas aeruginosa PGPR2]